MAETAEFKALRENLVAIRACISEPDVLKFAGELFQNGLISDAGHDTAIAVTGTPPGTVVARLVSEAMNKAGNSPDHFYKLVSILESRDPNLALILRKDHRSSKVETSVETHTQSSDHPGLAQVTATHSLGRPGEPYATNVTHNSLVLRWGKPHYGADSVQSYTITYRAEDDPPGRWVTQPSQSQLDHVELTHLTADTRYYFKVRAECTAGASADSESSDPIKTKRLPLAKKIIPLCKQLSADTDRMKIYQLPTHETMRKKGIVKVAVEQSQNFAIASHRVLMLVGATGAGKSTLINAMANYIMGVDWEDEYRFKLIHEEETAHDQIKSQTKCITAYTFNKQEGSPLSYTLTVIDTTGIEKDKEIVTHIKEFFSLKGDEGIDQLHGIGFVTQAPLAPAQRQVFDSILSVFGKDVANNIFLMVTFTDGGRPPVLDAARAAGVPFNSHFKFNNSALFAGNQGVNEVFWRISEKSFEDFFDNFLIVEPQSIQLSRDVLQERERLEITTQDCLSQIQAAVAKVDELKQKEQLLKEYEAAIITNRNFTYQVQITRERRVDLPPGHYTTHCLKCNYPCHADCPYASDSDKYKCYAMMNNRGSKNATCAVCPGQCSWRDHFNKQYRFELYHATETRTLKTYQVQVAKQRKVDLPVGQHTTNCLKCNYTCHADCPYPSDSEKYKCRAMKNQGSKSATCDICPGKCSWRDHFNMPYKFEFYQEMETRSLNELNAKYESAVTSKSQVEAAMKKIEEEFSEMKHAFLLQHVPKAKQSLQRLQEIALRPGPALTEVEYIDTLIETEQRESRPGWRERVEFLQDVRSAVQSTNGNDSQSETS